MGRLFDALLESAKTCAPAIPATSAIPGQYIPPENRKVAGIAARRVEVCKKNEAARQAARLLDAIRDQGLPDALLALDDADSGQLAALNVDELGAYARSLGRAALMKTGVCPSDYTHRTVCCGCGPVLLWVGAPAELAACPWCTRRRAGRSIPRPQVQCCDCTHFVPDPISPAGGTGTCGLALPYRSGEHARQPVTRRRCPEHRPHR